MWLGRIVSRRDNCGILHTKLERAPVHIAIFCHNYPPHVGGLEAIVWEVADRIARDHRVTVVTSAFAGRVGRELEGNVVVWRLPSWRLLELVGVPYPVPWGRFIAPVINELDDVDVVHCHGSLYATTLLGRYVASRNASPLVLTEHVGFVRYPSAVLNWMQRFAWRTIAPVTVGAADMCIAYNGAVARAIRGQLPQVQLQMISNGVSIDTFKPLDKSEREQVRLSYGLPLDQKLVLVVAREAAKKNLADVLAIKRNRFTLIVCGAVRNLKGEHLVDLGILPRDRMPALVGACDILLHPATGEGFPLAVQEAMAAGTPVLLRWDEGYSTEVHRDAVRAYAEDEVEGALHALLANPGELQRIAAAARAYAEEHWKWDRTVDEHLRVYREVLKA